MTTFRKKILIFQQYIPHYRVDLFNTISRYYDLTLVVKTLPSNHEQTQQYNFQILTTDASYFYGLYYFWNIPNLSLYHLIIFEGNARIVNLYLLYFSSSFRRIVLWGPWLNNNVIANSIKKFLVTTYRHTIFYCKAHRQSFLHLNVDPARLLVATNTIKCPVLPSSDLNTSCFDKFVSVGSLNSRKELRSVIYAFYLFNKLHDVSNQYSLVFVGTGSCLHSLQNLVCDLQLDHLVSFMGEVNDSHRLSSLYSTSIASVSYMQAGLSVMQALGHGVPFICHINAISGGETSIIKNRYNGFLINSISEMAAAFSTLVSDRALTNYLKYNSLRSYRAFGQITNMVDAINSIVNS